MLGLPAVHASASAGVWTPRGRGGAMAAWRTVLPHDQAPCRPGQGLQRQDAARRELMPSETQEQRSLLLRFTCILAILVAAHLYFSNFSACTPVFFAILVKYRCASTKIPKKNDAKKFTIEVF